MKNRSIFQILSLLAAIALLAPLALAQCQANVPAEIRVGESACVTVCSEDFIYPAIQLTGDRLGDGAVPVLILHAGCSAANTLCNETCTPIVPPSSLIFNGHPWYPDQWYGESDCMTFAMYYGHDGIWWLEIQTFCDGCFCITFDHQLSVNMRSGLTAVAGDDNVTLSWATASESRNDHFDVMRDGIKIGEVESQGNAASGHDYAYVDNRTETGRVYSYSLTAVDVNGRSQALGTASAMPMSTRGTVTEYALRQNYPNPFNPTTNIEFDVVTASHVTLNVFNTEGQQVASLVDREIAAGRHSVNFDGQNLTSGVYFYSISIGNSFSATRKMLLVK
jgi:hypothetical protein